MKEIEFRGKWLRDGKWVYGFLCRSRNGYSINNDGGGFSYMINSKTAGQGQYTGLKDRNGVKIFKGDIVKRHSFCWLVGYEKGGFYIGADTMKNLGASPAVSKISP